MNWSDPYQPITVAVDGRPVGQVPRRGDLLLTGRAGRHLLEVGLDGPDTGRWVDFAPGTSSVFWVLPLYNDVNRPPWRQQPPHTLELVSDPHDDGSGPGREPAPLYPPSPTAWKLAIVLLWLSLLPAAGSLFFGFGSGGEHSSTHDWMQHCYVVLLVAGIGLSLYGRRQARHRTGTAPPAAPQRADAADIGRGR